MRDRRAGQAPGWQDTQILASHARPKSPLPSVPGHGQLLSRVCRSTLPCLGPSTWTSLPHCQQSNLRRHSPWRVTHNAAQTGGHCFPCPHHPVDRFPIIVMTSLAGYIQTFCYLLIAPILTLRTQQAINQNNNQKIHLKKALGGTVNIPDFS